jgi:hypothetical protein
MTFGPVAPPRPQSKFPRQIFYRSTYIFLDIFMLGLLILGAQCHPWRILAFTSSAAIALLQAMLYLKKYLVNLRTTPATEIHDQAIMLLAELLNLHKEEVLVFYLNIYCLLTLLTSWIARFNPGYSDRSQLWWTCH